jgi:putative hydrolase of the HAD superfamily
MRGTETFQGILIDLYGTLVPTLPQRIRIPPLLEMGSVLGVDPETFAKDWGESVHQRILGQLGSVKETIVQVSGRQGVEPAADRVKEALRIRLAFSRSILESCGPVLPGVDALRAAGVRLAIVSDTSGETPQLWPSTPLGSRFDATVFSCETGFCKPDPRMYHVALRRLGLIAEQCAYVGDGGSRELTGAAAVGLSAFLYSFPDKSSDPDTRFDPDVGWIGPTLQDLREILTSQR